MNTYQWLKQDDKAAVAMEKAFSLVSREAELKPREAMAHATLATLSVKKKLTEQARGHVQTALALSPDDPEVLESSAATYEGLGVRARAVKLANKAMQKSYAADKIRNDPDAQGIVSDPRFRANGR